MKNLIFITLMLFVFSSLSYSQFDILNKVKDKVQERTDRKIDEGIDKGLDNVEEDMQKKNSEEDKETEQNESNVEEEINQPKSKPQDKKAALKTYSKYDFVAGEKTVFFDDFSQDEIGDFPVKWNTNSGGEVVEIESMGKWFTPNWGGTYYPDFNGPLPENFTIEFDLIINADEEYNIPSIVLDIISTLPDERMDGIVPGSGGIGITFSYFEVSYRNWKDGNYGDIDNRVDTDIIEKKMGSVVRVSLMAQKQRVRVWLDEKKLVDLPRFLPAGLKYDRIRFFEWGQEHESARFYLKNFRVAAGVPDMRNKLITEGKLVTHGIYFDSGSDRIKPESYGTLKEIAKVLSENSDVKVTIIGHTDSDGSDASNLELSKKRAASVKNALSGEFSIDASRMETDGKGESQPMDNNNTPEGKANNRRVEFIKV
jgi:OmpA-OmpF porin, OOP family